MYCYYSYNNIYFILRLHDSVQKRFKTYRSLLHFFTQQNWFSTLSMSVIPRVYITYRISVTNVTAININMWYCDQ